MEEERKNKIESVRRTCIIEVNFRHLEGGSNIEAAPGESLEYCSELLKIEGILSLDL